MRAGDLSIFLSGREGASERQRWWDKNLMVLHCGHWLLRGVIWSLCIKVPAHTSTLCMSRHDYKFNIMWHLSEDISHVCAHKCLARFVDTCSSTYGNTCNKSGRCVVQRSQARTGTCKRQTNPNYVGDDLSPQAPPNESPRSPPRLRTWYQM